MHEQNYDYIIVGAGSAGCLLANRLSADPNTRVLLVEAGKKDNYFWIDIPVGYLFTINNPRTDWCYEIDPDPGLNGRSIGYARGKVLGGCTSINAMIYMRGQKSDYDHWQALGNPGWGWDDVLPLFKKFERYQHGSNEYHGSDGELRVEERRVNWQILDAWRDAAEQCGIPKISEFNRGDNFGNAYFQMNQKKGVRWNASKAFLRPISHRPNLTVVTETAVEKILLEHNRAIGIRAHYRTDAPTDIHANREVILSAGSIGSPQLLQLSGIGPASLLQKLGITPLHHNENVGKNLQDHLQIRTVYKVSNTVTLNQRYRSLWGRALMGLEYMAFRTGPLTMPPSQLGAFAKSDPEQPTANMEWHVQPLSLDKFGSPLHRFNAITPSVCNLRPESRGEVMIKSANWHDHPSIKTNYLSTAADLHVAVAGLKKTREIMAAQALQPFQPEELKPGVELQSDAELVAAAGDLGTTIFHPVGTCKMGVDNAAVVNPSLKVIGIDGLRVVDASVMPTITSGNTNAPTMMIAEKAAQMILADRVSQ
jgi:choline dehydrogenase